MVGGSLPLRLSLLSHHHLIHFDTIFAFPYPLSQSIAFFISSPIPSVNLLHPNIPSSSYSDVSFPRFNLPDQSQAWKSDQHSSSAAPVTRDPFQFCAWELNRRNRHGRAHVSLRIDEAMADQLQSPVLPEDLVSEAIPGRLDGRSGRKSLHRKGREVNTKDVAWGVQRFSK